MTGLLLAVVVAASPVRAAPPSRPVADAERVMRLVAAGLYEPAAVEMAHQYVWPGPKDRFDGLFKKYADTLANAGGDLGTPLREAELLRHEPLGRSLARLTFAVKFERHVTVWRLTYYRPAADWKLHNVFFDIHPQAVEKLFQADK